MSVRFKDLFIAAYEGDKTVKDKIENLAAEIVQQVYYRLTWGLTKNPEKDVKKMTRMILKRIFEDLSGDKRREIPSEDGRFLEYLRVAVKDLTLLTLVMQAAHADTEEESEKLTIPWFEYIIQRTEDILRKTEDYLKDKKLTVDSLDVASIVGRRIKKKAKKSNDEENLSSFGEYGRDFTRSIDSKIRWAIREQKSNDSIVSSGKNIDEFDWLVSTHGVTYDSRVPVPHSENEDTLAVIWNCWERIGNEMLNKRGKYASLGRVAWIVNEIAKWHNEDKELPEIASILLQSLVPEELESNGRSLAPIPVTDSVIYLANGRSLLQILANMVDILGGVGSITNKAAALFGLLTGESIPYNTLRSDRRRVNNLLRYCIEEHFGDNKGYLVSSGQRAF